MGFCCSIYFIKAVILPFYSRVFLRLPEHLFVQHRSGGYLYPRYFSVSVPASCVTRSYRPLFFGFITSREISTYQLRFRLTVFPFSSFVSGQAFFSLPLDEKEKVSVRHNKINRGYTAFEEETLDPTRQTRGDTKEGFYLGREVAMESEEARSFPLHGPNVWPDPVKLPRWRRKYRAESKSEGRVPWDGMAWWWLWA